MWNTQSALLPGKQQPNPPSIYDIPAGCKPSLLGASIVENIHLKGFCTLDAGLDPGLQEAALREVDAIRDADCFEPPPPVVVEGLLGHVGSALIAILAQPDADSVTGGEAITQLDSLMSDIGAAIAPMLLQLGFEIEDRTVGILHETGSDQGSNDRLTEVEAQKWLTQFWWHRIMVVLFLGPDEGKLVLEPYLDEESWSHTVPTKPGMMVILRPDVLLHSHTSAGKAIALSTFFMQPVNLPKPSPPPYLPKLLDWIMDQLHRRTCEDQRDPAVPRELQRMASHMFQPDTGIAVRSCPGRFPTTWDSDAWTNSLTAGCDVLVVIPNLRWDHEKDPRHYDTNLESWKWGASYVRHGSFCDGLDLFDNKVFNLSPNEAKGMDPCQRMLLEVAYEGLLNAGLRKKDIMASHTAVYVGHTSTEWNNADRSDESRRSQGSGSVMCIYSNRINYCLGLKGPSISIDQEGASAITAVHLASRATEERWSNREGKGGLTCGHGIGVGSYMQLSARFLSQLTAMGCFSEQGRSFSFNASADGLGRGEGIAGLIVKPCSKLVDGRPVFVEGDPPHLGILASTGTNSSGMATGMRAPHGPSIQELLVDSLDKAEVSPLDVDAVEVHGEGRILPDVIDVSTALFSLRKLGSDEMEASLLPALIVGSVKTNVGHAKENGGAFALIKAIRISQVACVAPNCHFRQLNPDLKARGLEDLAVINSELMGSVGIGASYTSVVAHGIGGSNSEALVWNTTQNHGKVSKQEPPLSRNVIVYWPGGGGELPEEATDCQSYHIVGSWTRWEDPVRMEPEGNGIFGFTVILGENNFELFQILLDGDDQRILHPDQPWGLKNSHVYGPESAAVAGDYAWAIDGRKQMALKAVRGGAQLALDDQEVHSGDVLDDAWVDTTDAAEPGEAFRVRLQISGKWRVVNWEKIGRIDPELGPARTDGTYYIIGDFTGWTFDPMTASLSEFGVYIADVRLFEDGGDFQIVRDRSWDQVFYPKADPGAGDDWVLGPNTNLNGASFSLGGSVGDVFRVEFSRIRQDGKDVKKISWQRLQSESTPG